jgi:FAD/FMN-containing dehydrogenase
MLEAAVKSEVVAELGKIVGNEFVSTNQADLYIYSQDMTPAEPSWPDIVALPKSVAEVQAIIRLANKEKVPVIPYVAGCNIGGLTIPLKGGILLDLKRMDRIIEVNDTDMYAVVEPGVTFGIMKAHLEKHHPNLMYTYCFTPPSSGIVTNALLQGLDDLSFRYGAASRWVSGLEVVLPTGELVRIGSCAASRTWQALVPFPELAGLFLGWQGTTGIITAMALSLWPKPKHSLELKFHLMDLDGAYEFLRAISRTRIPDDIIGLSYPYAQISELAYKKHVKACLYPAKAKRPEDPEMVVTMEISGNTENELNAKLEVIEKVVKEELKAIKLIGPQTSTNGRALFPKQAVGVVGGGGGLNWVGCYGPMSNWLETAKKGCALQDKYDLARSCYTRVMSEGHFVGLRWMLPFDKGDPQLVERIRGLCSEQLDMVLDMGYIPYKAPVWAIRKLEERADPNWVKLHRKIKEMLDPNNILNPGRWGAPQE